ncbi:glycosyl transferase group 1 [Mizugakiibacter sediminis]|uniref:Glycosyl transferase family 1 n=1 Tax=Mizugakiibacter sediminis TaxID=1475481 RepID=A0A0K8QND8_9GAMM|nr:glycosyltransferase [Mizugakiibacter sediminis]GAP66425.1 glycosyl transferase group 1 [Mizugakiibacter sediminis]
MNVNLIAWDNGFGLTRNLRLLGEALTASGHRVSVSAIRRGKLRKILRPKLLRARIAWQRLRGGEVRSYDVNLMLEHVRAEYFPVARHNVLMPHPEWFLDSDRAALGGVDRVFALTRHAVPIFERLGKPVDYVGFTSEDRLDRGVPRERAFFHLAGRSQNKGTEALLALWRRHPEWPRLTVVQNPRTAKLGPPAANIDHRIDYLSDAELRRLQNAHRFHLCPSETEGFGHYLVEAMGVGAVTVTVDAPPMHEMVTPERGALVGHARTGTQHLATTYYFDAAAMEATVTRLLGLDDAELERMGDAARAWFEANDRAFRERIGAAVAALG